VGWLALALLLPSGAGAQSPEALIADARAARDAGDFVRAAELAGRYLEARPDDGGSWWLLAQLSWWSGDPGASRRAYRRAVELMPADDALRLDFARMLVGVGWLAEARAVLGPLLAAGDATSRSEAERLLADIRALTPPWLLARASAEHDDQPRTSAGLEVEAGRYLGPSLTLAARISPRALDAGGEGALGESSLGGVVTRVGLRGVTGLSSPDGRWGLGGAGGVLLGEGSAEPVYLARLTLRTLPSLVLRGQLERGAYEWTRTSLDSLLMTTTSEVALDGGAGPRWAGALQGRQERFGDDNRISTVFGWLLAPVVPGLRLGYALSWQDAQATRWERDPGAPGGPGRPPGRADTIPGRYAPYHTPDDLVVHTLLLEGSGALGEARLRGQLGVGVRATEEAPLLLGGTGSELLLSSYTRSLTPWYATLSLSRPLGGGAEIEVGGELRESSYYRLGRLSVGILKRWR
jgi:hypothetical protein